jgi:hypothetical protein
MRIATSKTSQRRDMMLMADHNETNLEDAKVDRELQMCACVMEALQRYYPGHVWMVRAGGGGEDKFGREKPRGIEIKIPAIMPVNKCYVIPMPMLLKSENEFMKRVRDAGGEICERYNLPRSGFELDPFLIARNANLRSSYKTPVPGGK